MARSDERAACVFLTASIYAARSQSPCKLDRVRSVFQLSVFIDRQRPWSTVIPEFVARLRSLAQRSCHARSF